MLKFCFHLFGTRDGLLVSLCSCPRIRFVSTASDTSAILPSYICSSNAHQYSSLSACQNFMFAFNLVAHRRAVLPPYNKSTCILICHIAHNRQEQSHYATIHEEINPKCSAQQTQTFRHNVFLRGVKGRVRHCDSVRDAQPFLGTRMRLKTVG